MTARLYTIEGGRAHHAPAYHKSRDRSHGRSYRYWDKLPAWRTLCSRGRDLVMFVLRAYHPDEPNAFELSDGVICSLLDCSPGVARRVFNECLERGWFVLERKGRQHGPISTRSRVVSLTRYETANRPARPDLYEAWRPAAGEAINGTPYVLRPRSGERLKKRRGTGQKMTRSKKPKPTD